MEQELFPSNQVLMEAMRMISGHKSPRWRAFQAETLARFHEECGLIRANLANPTDRHDAYNKAGALLDRRLFQGLWNEFPEVAVRFPSSVLANNHLEA